MATPRRTNTTLAERVLPDCSAVAAISATTSLALCTMERDYIVDSFECEFPGGYTADASNRYTITLQAGATVLSTVDLTPSGVGTLADLAFGQGTPGTSISGAKGDVLKVVCTKNGTAANLPIGTRFVAHCRLL